MSPTVRARLELLAAGLLFSTGGAAIKLCRDLGGVEIAGLRSAVATLALLLLVPGGRRWPSPSIGLVSLAFAATLGLFAVANRMTTAANCTFLQGTAPAWLMAARRTSCSSSMLSSSRSTCGGAKRRAAARHIMQ